MFTSLKTPNTASFIDEEALCSLISQFAAGKYDSLESYLIHAGKELTITEYFFLHKIALKHRFYLTPVVPKRITQNSLSLLCAKVLETPLFKMIIRDYPDYTYTSCAGPSPFSPDAFLHFFRINLAAGFPTLGIKPECGLPFSLTDLFSNIFEGNITSPVVIWAFLRTISVVYKDSRDSTLAMVDHVGAYCSSVGSPDFQPHGIVQTFSDFSKYVDQLRDSFGAQVDDVIDGIVDSFAKSKYGGEIILAAFSRAMSDKRKKAGKKIAGVKGYIERVVSHPLFALILRNLFRVWMEYDPLRLLSELSLDIMVLSLDDRAVERVLDLADVFETFATDKKKRIKSAKREGERATALVKDTCSTYADESVEEVSELVEPAMTAMRAAGITTRAKAESVFSGIIKRFKSKEEESSSPADLPSDEEPVREAFEDEDDETIVVEEDVTLAAQAASESAIDLLTRIGVGVGLLISPSHASANTDFLVKWSRDFSSVATALDKSKVASAITDLQGYLTGVSKDDELKARCRMVYPDSFLFVDAFTAVMSTPAATTAVEMDTLAHFYHAFLKERPRWSRDDDAFMRCYTSVAATHCREKGIAATQCTRAPPAFFCMAGPAGLGKSFLISQIGKTISKAVGLKENQCVYNINSRDQFQSGYAEHSIWKFDDFGQVVDTDTNPATDFELLFRLSTTAPLVLHKADVESKGTFGRCHLILGGTNIKFRENEAPAATLRKYVKSCVSPDGVRRRLTHLVFPHLKPGFVHNSSGVFDSKGHSVFLNNSWTQAFYFQIQLADDSWLSDDMGDRLNLTYVDLLKIIGEEWKRTRNFRPETFEPSDDHVQIFAQGISNIFVGSLASTILGGGAAFYAANRSYCGCGSTDLGTLTPECYTHYAPLSAGQLVKDDVKVFIYNDVDYNAYVRSLSKHSFLCVAPECVGLYNIKAQMPAKDAPPGCAFASEDMCIVWCPPVEIPHSPSVTYTGLAVFLGGLSLLLGAKQIYDHFHAPVSEMLEKVWVKDANGHLVPQTRDSKAVSAKKRPFYHRPKEDFYSHGPDVNDVILSERLAKQLPSVESSLFAILSPNGTQLGHAFALNQKALIMPSHVRALMVGQPTVFLVRDAFCRKIELQSEDSFSHTWTEYGPDFGIFELNHHIVGDARLVGCRDHMSKMNVSVGQAGKAFFLRRGADGTIVRLDCDYTYPVKNATYKFRGTTVSVPIESHRIVKIASKEGWCGGVYVHHSSDCQQAIIGVHVAGTVAGNAYGVMHLVPPGVRNHQFNDGDPKMAFFSHGADPKCAGRLVNAGLTAFCGSSLPAPHYATTGIEKTPFNDLVADDYDIAPQRPFTRDGERIDPHKVALAKFGDRVAELAPIDFDFFKLAGAVGALEKPIDNPEISWDYCTESHEIGSVTRSNAAGEPFGSSKEFLFEKGERVILTGSSKDALNKMISILSDEEPGTVMSVSKWAFKDEPRPIEKCEEGKVRVYNVVSAHDYLIQRKVFYWFVSAIMQDNLKYGSGLGIPPDKFGDIHEYLMTRKPFAVLDMDQSHMDGHVMMTHLMSVLAWCFGTWNPVGTYKKIPTFGYVNRQAYLMYVVMCRLGNIMASYSDATFIVGTGHPSGSFLTSFINYVVDRVLIRYICCKAYDLSLDEVHFQHLRDVNTGDDTVDAFSGPLSKIPMDVVIALARRAGFEVTSASKGNVASRIPWNPSLTPVSDYTFLSRRFAKCGDKIVGLLDPSKVCKSIAFCDKGKFVDNAPSQFLSFFDEISYHQQCDWEESRALLDRVSERFDRVEPGWFDKLSELYKHDKVDFQFEILCKVGQPELVAHGGESETKESLGGNTIDSTTTFVEEVVEDDQRATDSVENWRESGMEAENHGESEVWVRPHVVSEFDLTAITPEVAWLDYFPTAYFRGNFNAQAKLANYAFLNATVCIRVVMSASPLAAGKLLLHVRPLGALAASNAQASGDPCVELDISSGSTAVMRVPYVNTQSYSRIENYSDLITGNADFDFMSASIRVIAPISQVGTSNITIKVFSWLEDVKLHCPTLTGWPLAPQGVGERESGELGPLKKATRFIKTIGGVVTDTKVLVSAAEGVLLLAGLSKPTMVDNTTFYQSGTNIGAPHMHGVCPAQKLAATQEHVITLPENSFSVDHDEMDIAKYCSRPGLFTVFNWDVTQPSQSTIFTVRVNPGVHADSGGLAYMLPLSACARFFRFWHGSITYRFALAKTRFHGGLLEILFQPGLGQFNITDDAQATICYRAVWDVQESSSIEVTVPYNASIPWSTVIHENPSAELSSSAGSPTGFIHVRVLNPLVTAQNTVTDNVACAVYISGGPDMEFALPCLPNVVTPPAARSFPNEPPIRPLPPPHRVHASRLKQPLQRRGRQAPPKGKEEVVVPQAGGVFQRDETVGVSTPHDSLQLFKPIPINVSSENACVGERITNLRFLLKRFGIGALYDQVSDYTSFTWRAIVLAQPFASSMFSMFAFCTGGGRIQTQNITNSTALTNQLITVHMNYDNLRLLGTPEVLVPPGETRVIEVPYYNVVPYVRTSAVFAGTVEQPLSVDFRSHNNSTLAVAFACGDDFTFGWQTGPGGYPLQNDVGYYFPPYNAYL